MPEIDILASLTLIADKDRLLGEAQSEIKALRATEALKDKAVEEVIKEYQWPILHFHTFFFFLF